MSRLINRIRGRVHGWFDSKEARSERQPLPARFRGRAQLALTNLEDRCVPATFTVLNTNDSLAGSLRQAITDANASAGPDTIDFDSSFSTGIHVIPLLTALPTISGVAIGNDLTITGPGADHLVITRAAAINRPFVISPATAMTTTISGLTISGFSGTNAGGAIGVTTATTLVLDGVQFIGNTSSVTGGAIDINAATDLTIRNSLFAYNYASQGGAIDIRTGTGKTLNIENSTIANNTAHNGAGGIQWANGGAATTNITNCTITGNTSYNSDSTAGVGGGGLQNHQTTPTMTLTLNSTILAGNYAYNGRSDASFGAGVTVNAQYNLIGVSDTFVFNDVVPGSNKTGTQAAPLSANLGGFVRSSGSTFVIRPNAGSLAINNGDPAAPLVTDQRGLPRAASTVDIGAVEIQNPATEPANSATTPANVTVGGGADHTFTVTYQLDGGNIDFSTLGTGDVVMLAPTGAKSLATFVSAAPAANASTIVATYKVDAPGGTWDVADYGTYTIILAQDEVKTAAGASLNPGILGSFNARVGTTYTVTSTADTATGGTLREAITNASAAATLGTQDKIVFDAGVFGTPQTILLTAALPTISDSLDIVGPGPGLVTLQRGTASSTFTFLPMNKTIGNAVITISDVNLKGSTNGSPLITTSDEWVTLTNVNISNNTVSTATNTIGGQIMAGTSTNSAGRLTLNNCSIINSRVTSTAATAGANGGAILIQNGSTLILNGCTIENNTASGTGNGVGQGGGIAFTNTVGLITSSLIVTNSTISGNTSNNNTTLGSGGGGIFFNGIIGGDGFLIRNSTIANNIALQGTTAGGTGGGIALRILGGTARIQNSTITGNTSTNTSATPGMGGGGVALASVTPLAGATVTLELVSSILSGNTSNAGNGHDDLSIVIAGNVTATSSYSAIGDPDGFTLSSSTKDLDTANSAIAMLKLGPLAVTGPGTTKTRSLQIGSTAINAGSNPSPALTLDQTGNPRVQGSQIDIGATEHIFGPPTAAAGSLPTVNADLPANNPYQFTITYTAEALMKRSTIGDALEVQVTPTAGSPLNATFVSADSGVDAQIITATYQILPPGGTWDGADNNLYTVSILGNSVFDTDNLAVVANPNLGSFTVAVPTTFTVTNTSDSGPGSLRDAILAANANAGAADVILFDASFNTPQTITLSGEAFITDPLTLTGPAGRVTLSGGGVNRIFTIDGPGNINVSLSNLNLTNTSASTRGGAITINNEVVTLTDCSISNSTSSTNAGAFAANPGGAGCVITLIRSTFTSNKASLGGVADLGGGNTTVIATDCTFSGNVSTGAGGVFAAGFPSYSFTNCLFTGNSAAGAGGVFQFANGSGPAGIFLNNCTLSGNTATSGGAINVNVSASYLMILNIRNSTITGNRQSLASGNGGAILWSNSGANSRLHLNSTIVAGNLLTNTAATASPDIRFSASGVWSAIQGDNNLIGVSEAGNFTFAGNNPITPGTKAAPVNPLLLPLANNGGLTQTHALIPGVSPTTTIDAGNNIAALTTDQRGGTFLREENGVADIGAYERVQGNPLALPAMFPPVTTLPSDPYTFTVTFANEAAFDLASFGGNDILVTGPNGYSKFATYTGDVANASYANGIDVTYTIPAPAGGWVGGLPNLYTVTVQGGNVLSTNAKSVPTTTVGQIAVVLPAIFAVMNTNDSGTGSLRQAILDANAYAGTADTIVFALPTFGTAQTITLTGGELPVSDSLTIQGTGANLLTVSGSGNGRIFNIGNASSLLTVTIQGMKLTGATTTGDGGAILAANEIVTLDRLWIDGNSAASGGGINMNVAGGTLNILNSTISANIATTNGAGVFLQCQTAATTLNVINSTISTNVATSLGGGVCLSNSGATTVVTLQNSTFANNAATTGGGFRGSSVVTNIISVISTVFDGNTATTGPSIALATVNSSHSALGTDGSFVQGTTDADIPTGTPLNLGALQDNGGAMPTHLPGSGSPLINAGSNPTSLTLDQRGLAREVGIIDIGAVEAQSVATPTVTGFTVNDGAAQRSRLTTITVTFSGSVNPASFAAPGAITLTRTAATATGVVGTIVQTGAAGANGLITVTQPGPANQLVLTFSNADGSNESAGVEYGSLTDGRWQLAVPSAGNFQSTLNDVTLRRLFGDFEGAPGSNGTVDGNDFATFGAAFGTSGVSGFSPFDYDNNGTIDSGDLGAVGARFGFSV